MNTIGARKVAVVAGAALAIASVWFVGHAIASSADALGDVLRRARVLPLVGGVALLAASYSAGSQLWWYVLDRLAPGVISRSSHWRIWALTNPSRYVPGRIWHVTSLMALLKNAGVPMNAVLTSIAVHMWINVVTACVTGLVLVVEAPWSAGLRAFACVGVVAGALLALHPRVLRGAIGLLTRGKDALVWVPHWRETLALAAGHIVSHVATGAAAFVVLNATLGMDVVNAPRVIAAQAVSFLAGYVSLVPAGIGVREAVLTLLLSPVAMPGVAALGAVVLRSAALVAELVVVVLAMLVRPRSKA